MYRDIFKAFAEPNGFLGRIASWSMNIFHRTEYKQTLELLDLQENLSVLEIGYNTGQMIPPIINQKALYTGIDLVSRYENKLKQKFSKTSITLIKADIEDFKLKPNKYDRIFMIHVIYFMKNPEQVLQKLLNALKPNGKLILSHGVPMHKSEAAKNIYKNKYHETDFVKLLKQVGFQSPQIITKKSWGQKLIFVTASK